MSAGDLAVNSVGSSELADDAVDTAAIQADAVTSGKVANGTLDATDLAADSVAASELADGSVDTAAIQADAVTGAKVATGTLDATDLAADSVAASELAADSVDTAAIQTGAVTSGKIANDAVNTAQVADASTTAGVGLKQADIGLAGTFTVTRLQHHLGALLGLRDHCERRRRKRHGDAQWSHRGQHDGLQRHGREHCQQPDHRANLQPHRQPRGQRRQLRLPLRRRPLGNLISPIPALKFLSGA